MRSQSQFWGKALQYRGGKHPDFAKSQSFTLKTSRRFLSSRVIENEPEVPSAANRTQARKTLEKLPLFTEKAYIGGNWVEAKARGSFDVFGRSLESFLLSSRKG